METCHITSLSDILVQSFQNSVVWFSCKVKQIFVLKNGKEVGGGEGRGEGVEYRSIFELVLACHKVFITCSFQLTPKYF